MPTAEQNARRLFAMPFAALYPSYLAKVERKGRSRADLDAAIDWLLGYDGAALAEHVAAGTTVERFFSDAEPPPQAGLITGVVCGVRVEQIEDPLMQRVRWLDKLVDELARGKPLEKVLRA